MMLNFIMGILKGCVRSFCNNSVKKDVYFVLIMFFFCKVVFSEGTFVCRKSKIMPFCLHCWSTFFFFFLWIIAFWFPLVAESWANPQDCVFLCLALAASNSFISLQCDDFSTFFICYFVPKEMCSGCLLFTLSLITVSPTVLKHVIFFFSTWRVFFWERLMFVEKKNFSSNRTTTLFILHWSKFCFNLF